MFASRSLRFVVRNRKVTAKVMPALSVRTFDGFTDHSTRSLSMAMEVPMIDHSHPTIVKMRSILDEHRAKNFGQTLFSRFAKEILVAADVNGDGKISSSEFKLFLRNIRAEDCLSADEIDDLLENYGESDGSEYFMYIDDVEALMLQ